MIVASIDIGTNTIILLIAEADIDKKKIIPLYNEQRIPRIGKGLVNGNKISEKKIYELLEILSDYKKKINDYDSRKILVTATSAFRISSNGDEIKNLINRKLGLNVDIVSGETEAELALKGAVFSYSDNLNNLVIDIGGGSTEIIIGNYSDMIYKKSFHAGVVSGKEKFLLYNPPEEREILLFKENLNQVFSDLYNNDFKIDRTIAIAGTPVTLAAIKLNHEEYNEDLLEGSLLKINEIENLIEELSVLTGDEIIKKYKSVIKGREDVLFAGTLILFHLMKTLKINEVIVSTKGIRYGAICKEFF